MRNSWKKIIVLMIPLVFFSMQTFAAVTVHAEIDDAVITTEDETQITVEVEGSMNADVPSLSRAAGLKIMQTGQSSNFQFINGSSHISKIYYYTVIPMEEGKFTIGPFTVKDGNKTYSSNTINLTVSKNVYSGHMQVVPPTQNQQQQMTQAPAQVAPAEASLFWITTAVDKKQVYVSEQILFTFKFYTRTNPLNADLNLPSFNDFVNEIVLPKKQTTERVNGVEYATFEKVIALFPTKAGTLTIDPATLELTYQEQANGNSRQQWDPFYFGLNRMVSKTKRLSSQPLTIEVKELPQPVPAGFTNLVGQFGMTATLSDTEVKTGDSITLEVKFNGAGSIRNALLPDLGLKNVKEYRDKPELETYQSQQGISGTKTFKVVVVPQEAGDYNLGDLEFAYFDPQKASYLPLKMTDLAFHVLPGENSQNTNALIQPDNDSVTTQQITYQDLAPLFSDAEKALLPVQKYFHFTLFLFIFCTCPFLLGMFVIKRKFSGGQKGPSNKQIRKQAPKKLAHRLSSRHLEAGTVIEAVQDFMAEYFSVAGQALTAQEMKAICLSHGVKLQIAEKIEKNISELEAARYGFDKKTAVELAVKELKEALKTLR